LETNHQRGPCMRTITTIGIDLAKKVFQVHGVDADGKAVVAWKLRRKDVLAFFAKLRSCLIDIEACGSAHYWARETAKFGHSVKLMPPKYVKAYVKRGRTDAGDAAAICKAVTRPSMSPPQLVALLNVPRKERTAFGAGGEAKRGPRVQLCPDHRGRRPDCGCFWLVDRIIEWIVALTCQLGGPLGGAAPLTGNGSSRSLLLVKTRLKFS
jgi:hypothetical protein